MVFMVSELGTEDEEGDDEEGSSEDFTDSIEEDDSLTSRNTSQVWSFFYHRHA